MIEWRRENRRRKGEDWGSRATVALLKLSIVAVLVWTGYLYGQTAGWVEARDYFTNIFADRVEKVEKDLVNFKMWHYGLKNFFFYDKGKLCFVTKAKDLENPKKWRRTR
jgi:hypothetical protein